MLSVPGGWESDGAGQWDRTVTQAVPTMAVKYCAGAGSTNDIEKQAGLG